MVRAFCILASVAVLAACAEPTSQWQGHTATAKVSMINTLDSERAAKRLLRDAPDGDVTIRFVSEEPGQSGEPVPLYTLTFADWPAQDVSEWQTLDTASAVQIDSGDGRRLILNDCETHPRLCQKAKLVSQR